MHHQFNRYKEEADKLTQGTQTPQTRARLQFLLSAMSAMKEFQSPEARANSFDEQRKASLRLRDAVMGERRTYSPMSDSGQPALIAADFSSTMAQLMMSSGPLYFGSPLLTNSERPD